jgi:tetracycline resistance efflux pump
MNIFSLLPPIAVLITAIITRRVMISLAVGIIFACLLATHFDVLGAISLGAHRLLSEMTSADHLYTFGFLFLLGILIELMTHSGSLHAYTRLIGKYISTPRGMQLSSLSLSHIFFLDDYLNTLMVGTIMKPLADKMQVARAKLAFLLNSMSAPLCVIIPASSWVAMILVQLQSSGISEEASKALVVADPFIVYLSLICYLFYPAYIMLTAWLIVWNGWSFGPMERLERIAQNEKAESSSDFSEDGQASIIDMLIPIATFMVALVIGLLYSGHSRIVGGTEPLLKALQLANVFACLFAAVTLALAVTILLYLQRGFLTTHAFLELTWQGIMLMKNSFFVLLFAWTFGSLLKNELQTGVYLASALLSSLAVWILPVMTFNTAVFISSAIGSAWGTIAIMFPLVVPMGVTYAGAVALDALTLIAPLLAASISGAVAGGHFSPIADAAFIASLSAHAHHLEHVYSQMFYSIPALLSTYFAYLLSGILLIYNVPHVCVISFLAGLVLLIVLLYLNVLAKRIHHINSFSKRDVN